MQKTNDARWAALDDSTTIVEDGAPAAFDFSLGRTVEHGRQADALIRRGGRGLRDRRQERKSERRMISAPGTAPVNARAVRAVSHGPLSCSAETLLNVQTPTQSPARTMNGARMLSVKIVTSATNPRMGDRVISWSVETSSARRRTSL